MALKSLEGCLDDLCLVIDSLWKVLVSKRIVVINSRFRKRNDFYSYRDFCLN